MLNLNVTVTSSRENKGCMEVEMTKRTPWDHLKSRLPAASSNKWIRLVFLTGVELADVQFGCDGIECVHVFPRATTLLV